MLSFESYPPKMKEHSSNLISIKKTYFFFSQRPGAELHSAPSADLQNNMNIISRDSLYLQKSTIIMPIETHSPLYIC